MDEERRERAKEADEIGLWHMQIKMLAKLHEEGILTDEEFSSKKQELLSRL